MELLQLQYFRAIATYGSMSRAAQMLFVSQPTLSVTMTRLEESLGFSLFVRQKGKLTLTPAGLQFLDCADRVLKDLDSTTDAIRAATSQQSDFMVRIASCLNDLIGRVMADHYDDLQHIHIQEQYCDNEHISRRISDRLADWGIVHGPAHALHLHHTLLHECPRVFVMREGHPLLRYDKLPASVLADQTYLCNRSRDEQDVLAYCGKKYRFMPQIESECDDCILEMHILNSTNCISTMPLLTYLKLLRTNPVRPLRYLMPDFDVPPVQTYIVRLHDHPLNSYSARLAGYIKDFLNEEDVKLDHYLKSGVVEQ